ncbi:shikimate dehydrogenase (NADP(+)) [Jannaschia pagri]|uniref:Shikimate dehydrogenase (NADP(+)) n=1 Tax=Jannaschia pagri TaxID=2829797 RepID=A0ABQ4NM38_9RHOB|nr:MULTISPECIES: shikimate dehydrogenase [unclassified Jannaschia]GIT91445.1 shikimate dehydrogenase (NADP(+)) [Jannaschia sp. AI_61]GIT95279.1 shikimate dehydrogenase (NADP(+)) [Jannaschia sp. AI_62]
MTIRLAGVIGDPISHSRSPRLHGHWLQRYGIDGQYIPLHVRPADLRASLELLPRLGLSGINVTLPHKEAVFELAHTTTERAKAVGSANTLTFVDGQIHADNTDGYGFLANLDQGAATRDRAAPALVLGAGGAARGVIAALLQDGTDRVTLTNRTAARAETLASQFPDRVQVVPWDQAEHAVADHGLLVNTTSLGMVGQPPLQMSLDHLPPETIVTDIVYTPLETPLLASARARGNVVVDGLGMLLHQAVPGFEAWFGRTPTVDSDLRAAVLA